MIGLSSSQIERYNDLTHKLLAYFISIETFLIPLKSKKVMKQKNSMVLFLCLLLSPYTVAWGEVLYSSQNNSIFVPFLNYQGQNYSAEFSLAGSDQLQLTSAIARNDSPSYASTINVDGNLNFNLQRVNFDGQLYSATITHQQDQLFKITNLSLQSENIAGRGNLTKSTLVNEVTQSQFNLLVSFYNLQNNASINLQAQNDIAVYSVTYQTIDPAGTLVEASALVALPVGEEKSFPLIAYQHGTEVLRNGAPSMDPNDLPSLGLAASGYVVVSSDYLGLGESTLLHPYVHAHSLATTVIDALRATKTLSNEKNISLNGQLFLIGYSEGGYATMAVHREIQRNYGEEFTVTASAPMAGPYDMSGSMLERFFDDTTHPNPYYFPYTILAYKQVYDFKDSLSEIFHSPYDQSISNLFDGTKSGSEINDAIPENRQLFTQNLYDQLQSQQNPWLKVSLYENDVYRWTPNNPTYLFHCTQDEQVPYQNTQVAYNYFQNIGASQVQLFAIDDESLNQSDVHSGCAIPLLLKGKELFDVLVN